ncbi:MAG TPA: penicillin-binding protein activator [Thermodesulfobacteriota bacterium]|nr:penicillin-binding protein activator [Thermodesulfobacteriota bacterium]
MSLPSIPQKSRGRKFVFGLLFLLLFLQSLSFAQPQLDDSVLFREGEVFLSKGDPERALWRFKRLVTEVPQSPLVNEAKFRMGVCYTQLKRPQDAIRTLNELFPTFLSASRMVQIFSLLGDNYLESKDRLTALHWYGKGLLVPGPANEELRKKVKSIMDGSNSEEELKSIEILYRGAYAGGYAKLRLAQIAKARGNDAVAKGYLAELEKEYRGMDYIAQGRLIFGGPSAAMKSKYVVGVILPQSGINAPFGERALQGIQSAIKETDSPLVSLVIRDSKGSPEEAEKLVEEMVNVEKAIAIIGPLLGVEVDPAAKKAQQLKTPLLTLSQKELPSGKGGFVFQNSLAPSDQIQTLADFAVKEMELQTFAIFYPNSPYGLYFKNLFTQEVNRRGGKLLGSVAYQEGQTDFGQEIRGFFKVRVLSKPDARRKKEEEYKPLLSVDGIFIPDTHDRVGMILSQMAYYGIKGTFLGTNAWNGPSLISIGGKAAEGVVFVDAFLARNPSNATARFIEEFRKSFQRDPETLEALSYDAAKFIKEILESKSVSSPLQLQEELYQIKNFKGVTGLKGFGEDGKAIRALSVLTVKRGQIERVSP